MEPRFLEARSAEKCVLSSRRDLRSGYVGVNMRRREILSAATSTQQAAMAPSVQSIVVFSALISLSFVGASRPVTVSSIVAPRSRLEVDQVNLVTRLPSSSLGHRI